MKRAAWGLLLLAFGAARAAEPGRFHLAFDHFYGPAEVQEALRGLQRTYPGLTRLESIGKSEGGRDLWLLTITNPATGRDTEKPGIYVDGVIHGNEIQGTEVCLYLAQLLLEGYENPKIKKLVDEVTFYIIPVINVDGRARFFEAASGYDHGRTALVPHDDDRDGLTDEDDVDDLDGDSEILEMRVADPFGPLRTDPEDPRLMVEVEPGERGEWRMLGSEGIDNDFDGRLNEDPPGYLDLNRNFGFGWEPAYVQQGAGEFPMSSAVSEALARFAIARPNLCFTVALHNFGGMILRGPGSKDIGPYPQSDIKVLDALGQEGEKILPGYRYLVSFKDLYTTHGDYDEWLFATLGTYGFVGELFEMSALEYRRAGEPPAEENRHRRGFQKVSERERLKFDDRVLQSTMFRGWRRFEHPQFGPIEIGGFRKFTTRIPPAFELLDMVHRSSALVLAIASQAPLVELALLEQKPLGDGLRRIRVRAGNPRSIPSLSGWGLRRRVVRRDVFSIEGQGLEVVSGGFVRDLELGEVEVAEHRPSRLLGHVPALGSTIVQWIVRGDGPAVVKYDSVKARDQILKIDSLKGR